MSATGHVHHHRWIVDALADDVARVEIDGERVVGVPRWLLPEEVREGDVLRVRQLRAGDRARLFIERDAEATRLARERSAEQVADIRVARDGGGDIVL